MNHHFNIKYVFKYDISSSNVTNFIMYIIFFSKTTLIRVLLSILSFFGVFSNIFMSFDQFPSTNIF